MEQLKPVRDQQAASAELGHHLGRARTTHKAITAQSNTSAAVVKHVFDEETFKIMPSDNEEAANRTSDKMAELRLDPFQVGKLSFSTLLKHEKLIVLAF